MAANDKPVVHDSLADLAKEAETEPYVLGTENGTVTFPDPGGMDWIEAERFMLQLGNARNSDALKKWLSPEDYKRLADSKPSLGAITIMTQRIYKHYEKIFGPMGEGPAS